MPKYSFERNFYFFHMGGSVTDSGLPTTPHMHYIGRTTTSCRPCTTFCVSHTEYDKKHLVNIKLKIFLSVLAFSKVKK